MNILGPVAPLLVFLLLWGIFCKNQGNWRSAFLGAAVVWGVLLTALTEILGLFHEISFGPLLGLWGLCAAAALLEWVKTVCDPRGLIKLIKIPELPRFELFALGGISFIAGMVGLIAWIAPPNTWDSMTYHMARVMHWIQDQSVADFPTHILRQLYLNPGSEFIILHFQILSGGDRLANLIQWFALIGSAIGVSLIAGRLGVDTRTQIFSAVASITLPIGILQGSSTQNDYVVAFWLVCFVYWMMALRSGGHPRSALWAGGGLGLAMLTKGTAYLYALPFLVWFSLSIFKSYRRKGLQLLVLIALSAAVINLGYYLRNYALFSNPLGIVQENLEGSSAVAYRIPNEVFSLPQLTSNVVRNIAINLGTPFGALNSFFESNLDQFHRWIGISPNDPRTTWPGTEFHINPISFDESRDGNLLHLILILLLLFPICTARAPGKGVRSYLACLVAAFLIFSLYLKWQPWNTRLELPLFILWSPILAVAVFLLQRRWIAQLVMILLLFGALPWVFLNHIRPLIRPQNVLNTPRMDQYFSGQPSLESSYLRAVRFVGKNIGGQCSQIGLDTSIDDWEYPLWVLLQAGGGTAPQMESVNVENVSKKQYAVFPQFTPCAIFVASSIPAGDLTVNNVTYNVSLATPYLSVLTPKK